ncbi:MAG: hypothetical protein JST30_01955 [Armatimonadetes bacterium]|nr:hypothetical protein [Armatimonadota bacterium]
MSISIKPNLFVRIEQLEGENAPRPLPLSSGFSVGRAYEVLGIHAPSESSEAFLILKNDRDEIWFVSNRHVRIVEHRPVRHVPQNSVHRDGVARPSR